MNQNNMKITPFFAIILCCLISTTLPLRAQIWTSNGLPNYQWLNIASSADGSVLVTSPSGYGPIFTSTNSGATWIPNNAPNDDWSVVTSADGTKMAAAGIDTFMDPITIWTSANSGTSWAQVSTLPFSAESWAMASSADGTKLALVAWNNPIYISTNSGSTWTATGTSDQYTTVSSSADGTKLVAAGWNTSAIYVSTDAGNTWTQHSVPFNSMWASACSADGTKMVVVGRGDPIYLSCDSGTTWTEPTNAPQTEWLSVASSADGNKIVAYDSIDNLIYGSTDGGIDWTSNSAPSYGIALASSADGNKLAAATYDAIYTTYSTPSPELNISSSGTLSWIVPSTNFVVQYNSDLLSTTWINLTNTPTLNLANLQDEIHFSPSNSMGFYRLIAQ